MKITVGKLVNALPSLNKLTAIKMPVKAGYRIAANIIAINDCPQIKAFDPKRTELANSLGTKSEDGSRYEFDPESQLLFGEAIDAMLSEEVEINLTPLSPEDFGTAQPEPSLLLPLTAAGLIVG